MGIGAAGRQRTAELVQIANGEASQVFKAQDFQSIAGIQKNLADKVCTFVMPGMYRVKLVSLTFCTKHF